MQVTVESIKNKMRKVIWLTILETCVLDLLLNSSVIYLLLLLEYNRSFSGGFLNLPLTLLHTTHNVNCMHVAYLFISIRPTSHSPAMVYVIKNYVPTYNLKKETFEMYNLRHLTYRQSSCFHVSSCEINP